MDHLLSKEQYFLYSIDNVLTIIEMQTNVNESELHYRNGHWKLYSKSEMIQF